MAIVCITYGPSQFFPSGKTYIKVAVSLVVIRDQEISDLGQAYVPVVDVLECGGRKREPVAGSPVSSTNFTIVRFTVSRPS
jgi:hypothetical protein